MSKDNSLKDAHDPHGMGGSNYVDQHQRPKSETEKIHSVAFYVTRSGPLS